MAEKCINIKHSEYKELLKQSGLTSIELSSKMGAYMTTKNTDEWPTLQQLGIKPIKAEVTQDFGWYTNRVYSDDQVRNLKARINRFNEKNPGIEYKFKEYKWGGNSYKGNLTYKVTSTKETTEPLTYERPVIYYPLGAETVEQRDASDKALRVQEEGVEYEQRIAYNLKVTEGLMKIKDIRKTISLNTKDKPYIEKNLRKQLGGKGVSDTQIDFIFEYMKDNNIQSINTEDLAIKLASEFTYIVESDITRYLRVSNDYKNTEYYANLTVPGGTNYTENEIRTPDITPSIKGHAQFSTDQGIGWFRSDEEIIGSETEEVLNDQLVPDMDFDDEGRPMPSFKTTEKSKESTGTSTKNRRILELQSDLFQKGRSNKDLVALNINVDTIESLRERGKVSDEEYSDYLKTIDRNINRNKFLQLLNKDNNWVKFFINTIIQDSAKRGYEKVLFPKGETAAKVEGHETITQQLIKVNKKLDYLNEAKITYIEESKEEFGNEARKGWKLSYNISNKKISGIVYKTKEEAKSVLQKEIKETQNIKKSLKTEGIEKLKPIEGFYEIRVGNILKKIDPNVRTITDEHGNQWYEYTIKPDDAGKAITLQREGDMPTEVRADFEKKKAYMLKTFPFVTDVIEDDTIPVAGLVEAGGNVIKVNPKFWTTDTIGHEFAHILIDSIGGLSNPLVAKGLELLKDSDIWRKTAKRYADLVEAGDGRFEKEVLAQAIGQETAVLYDETKQPQFVRWLQNIIRKISSFFGIEESAVTQLARKVIQGSPVQQGDVGAAEQRQTYKFTEEELQDEDLEAPVEEDKKITTIEKLRDKIKDALERKSSIYSRKRRNINKDRLDKILADINKEDNDPVEALKNFQDYAYTQTKTIHTELRTIKDHAEPLIKEGESYGVALKKLARWNDYVNGFNSLDDLSNFAFKMEEYLKDTKQIEKFKKVINPKILKETIEMRNEIRDFYLQEGKLQVAKFLTPHSKHIQVKYKEAAEKKFNTMMTKAERKKMSATELRRKKKAYIDQYVDIRSGQIRKETENAILNELNKASKDVGYMTRWVDNMLDSPDMVSSAMVDAFLDTMFNSKQERRNLHKDFLDVVRELENFVSNTGITGDLSKAYDFMLEVDQDGERTNNIIKKYRSSMWTAYNAFKDRINKFDWKDKDNLDWLVDNGYIDEVDRDDIYNDDMLEEEARERSLSGWKSINVPFEEDRWEDYVKARTKYIKSLEEGYKISQEESERLKDYADGYRYTIKDFGGTQLGSQTGYKNYKEAKKAMLFLEGKRLKIVKNEVSDIINSEAAELYIKWLRKNTWDYRSPINSWVNPQYDELMNISESDPRRMFYDFVTENLEYIEENLPTNNKLLSRLPGMIKYTGERMTAEDNTLKTSLQHAIKDSFDVMADETERGTEQITDEEGNKVQFVPVYYTNNLSRQYEEKFDELSNKEEIVDFYSKSYNNLPKSYKDSITLEEHAKKKWATKESVRDQSYDLATGYYKYFSSAIDYKHKQEILPQMEMARYLLGEREVTVTTKKGKPIISKTTGKEVEPITGKESKIYQQLSDWFEAMMYGIKEVDTATILNGKVDVGKLANLLNKYTSLNLLGMNFVQGTANVVLGETMQFIDSMGGDYYNTKELSKAKGYYFKNMMGIIDDIGRRHPKHVINLLNLEFDTINEYDEGIFRKDSKFRELLSTNTLFFTTHMGEHFMQTAVMLAMLDRVDAEVDGEVVGSMKDMAKVKNGKLVFETEDGRKITNWDNKARSDFSKRTKRVLSSIHGEYSDEGRTAVQRYAAGRLGMMFRKFIVTGVRRRWSRGKINNLLGETKEGYYLTAGKFLKDVYKSLFTLRWSTVSTEWDTMLDREKANVKKALTEWSFMLASMILSSILVNLDGDDDDEWSISFLTYQALRYRAELMFFVDVRETLKILRSPAAAMSQIENTIKLTGQLFDFFGSGLEFEEYERGNWKGKKKISKTMINFIPAVKQMYRLKYVDDQINWLRN